MKFLSTQSSGYCWFSFIAVLNCVNCVEQNTTELEGSCNQLEAQEDHLQKKIDITMTNIGVLRKDMLVISLFSYIVLN